MIKETKIIYNIMYQIIFLTIFNRNIFLLSNKNLYYLYISLFLFSFYDFEKDTFKISLQQNFQLLVIIK